MTYASRAVAQVALLVWAHHLGVPELGAGEGDSGRVLYVVSQHELAGGLIPWLRHVREELRNGVVIRAQSAE